MITDISKIKKKSFKESEPKPKVVSFLSDRNSTDNYILIQKAQQCWDSLRDFRDQRIRARKFLKGDQWSDLMTDPDNPSYQITEDGITMYL